MIHLILCKIYDERFTRMDDMVEFRVAEDDTDQEIKTIVGGLFTKVKKKYRDVLNEEDSIDFDGHTLRYIIGKYKILV